MYEGYNLQFHPLRGLFQLLDHKDHAKFFNFLFAWLLLYPFVSRSAKVQQELQTPVD